MVSAIIVLGLAALGGLTMAAIRLGGKPLPPTWMALGHGAVAVVGVGLLTDVWVTSGMPWLAQVAFGVFVLAALGGLVMFLGFHLRARPLPVLFVFGHGIIAASAYVLLLLSHFRGS